MKGLSLFLVPKYLVRRAVVDAALGAQLTRMAPAAPGSEDRDVVRQFVTEFHRINVGEPYTALLPTDELARDTERLDHLDQRYIEPTPTLVVPSIERPMASGRMARVPMDVLFFAMVRNDTLRACRADRGAHLPPSHLGVRRQQH
ncbi:hypothetical protein [Streptomyces sp. DSM 40750]|uniref:hypothetical protein n=1 Tax=Streptomyces sp. DSM 40750 TaxID=2801030 RepID=UPI00214C4CB0|nr:hypothetical protein [Streptomyces sp. DSM 40750]UUU26941.1 hypothetical protein JIX55_45720 [Streptomyces sp. DSM 40750]